MSVNLLRISIFFLGVFPLMLSLKIEVSLFIGFMVISLINFCVNTFVWCSLNENAFLFSMILSKLKNGVFLIVKEKKLFETFSSNSNVLSISILANTVLSNFSVFKSQGK